MTAVGQTCRLQVEQGRLHTASQGAHAKCPQCVYVCGESCCFSGMHVDPQTLHSRTSQYDAQHGALCLFNGHRQLQHSTTSAPIYSTGKGSYIMLDSASMQIRILPP